MKLGFLASWALAGGALSLREMFELPDEPEVASTLPFTNRGANTVLPGMNKARRPGFS